MEKKLHVGLILDGNRRFAKKRMFALGGGYDEGAKNVERFLSWSSELGIGELSLYCFSKENFKRDKGEIFTLTKLFKEWIGKFQKELDSGKSKFRVRFIGNLEMFDNGLRKDMVKIMETTENLKGPKVNFLVGYGGRSEIVKAVKLLTASGEKINEKNLNERMDVKSQPNLIIRTGGEIRMSGFLPWQSVYSELFFLKKLWPEFERKDLVRCLNEFKKRKRNFGG